MKRLSTARLKEARFNLAAAIANDLNVIADEQGKTPYDLARRAGLDVDLVRRIMSATGDGSPGSDDDVLGNMGVLSRQLGFEWEFQFERSK